MKCLNYISILIALALFTSCVCAADSKSISKCSINSALETDVVKIEQQLENIIKTPSDETLQSLVNMLSQFSKDVIKNTDGNCLSQLKELRTLIVRVQSMIETTKFDVIDVEKLRVDTYPILWNFIGNKSSK